MKHNTSKLTLLFIICSSVWTNGDELEVQLPKGKIKATILQSKNNNEFYGFYKIPYAAPPVGNLRLKPPQDVEPWNETIEATDNLVSCYTAQYSPPVVLSEDCLFVNVFTPVKPGESEELLPVYVWIHGGAFRTGAGNDFKPQYFIDKNIVIVTVNYRLGPLGFLSTEDSVIPGNYGLKDQRFAMEWVHSNIKYFNGDPNRVTIGGQSAGSACVGLHLLGPWNSDRELFHQAIQESSSPLWNFYNDDARQRAFTLGQLLDDNFVSNDSEDLLHLLQSVSPEAIINFTSLGHWAPIVESEGDFSYPPLESFKSGNVKKIPLLIGTTSEEQLNSAQAALTDGRLSEYDTHPEKLLSSPLLNIENKTRVGELMRSIYTKSSFAEDFAAYIRYFTDDTFRTPSVKEAELMSQYSDVYLYQFSYKGPLGQSSDVPHVEGCGNVVHAEELNYMWLMSSFGNVSNYFTYSEEDQLMSERLLQLWSNFIYYGNPTPEADPLLQNLTWPKVDSNDLENILYVNLNETIEIMVNPRNYQEVKKVYDESLQTPYIIYTNNDGSVW